MQIGGRAETCRKVALASGLAADVERLDQRSHMRTPDVPPLVDAVQPQSLRDASLQLATAWYTLHGFETFIPVTQSVEDVDVRQGNALIKVQVKTSTKRGSATAWNVGITHRENGSPTNRVPYRPGSIDEFFIVTLDGSMYRIPFEAVAGMTALNLGRKYEQYRVSLFA